MPAPFDPADIGTQIIAAVNNVLQADVTNYVAFAKRQADQLAQQAAWIAQGTITGEFKDEQDRDWFLQNLQTLTKNFAHTIAGLTILTIEKAWNAIVGVLWKAINGAIAGAGIPIQLPVPSAPPA